MMKRQLERYGKWLIAVSVLIVLAVIVGSYILVNQRLAIPGRDVYEVRVEMSATPGLTPGLGQPANVAGVRVGDITGVELKDGRAIVALTIRRSKLAHVWANAHATLVPNTPLKDLQMEVAPGGGPGVPYLADGGLIPIARTSAPIDSDELTNALDDDTRQFFGALVGGADGGTHGRGGDLREILKTLAPTAEDLKVVSGALAERRRQLRRLVGNLATLTRSVATHDQQISQVVLSGSQTVTALAAEEAALRASVNKLPDALKTTRDALVSARGFAQELGPTSTALRPVARAAPGALRAARPLLAEALPILRDQVRPFVRSVQPIARDLGPITRDLSAVTPSLSTAFRVLQYTTNELAYNPEGKDEGFLFWTAWFLHNGVSFLSGEDANGAAWRGLGVFSCQQLTQSPGLTPILQALTGVVPGCAP